MHKITEQGLLTAVPFRPSPYCNDRPAHESINLLVIHNISLPPAEFGGRYIDDFFLGQIDFSLHPYFETLRDKKVSAHILIDRNGDLIQYVPFSKRAWHAGVSKFEGRENCNDFSIGIELEGTDDIPFAKVQYQQLATLAHTLMAAYPITIDRIVGHSQIAPGRKSDPGPAFDWDYFLKLMNS